MYPLITTILVLVLCLVAAWKIIGSPVNAVSAFSGLWLLSLTCLAFFSETVEFVTTKAALIVMGVHLAFFIVYIFTSVTLKGSNKLKTRETLRYPRVRSKNKHASNYLKWSWRVSTVISIAGAVLAVQNSNMLVMMREEAIAATRGDILQGSLAVPFHIRFMCNLLYISALAGALLFRHRQTWIYIFPTFFGLILYSFSNGGRGAVLVGGLLVFWGVCSSRSVSRQSIYALCTLCAIILFYVVYIATTRPNVDWIGNLASLYGPVPALSQLIERGAIGGAAGLNLTDTIIYREYNAAIGIRAERYIEGIVVGIPFTYNVYTFIADQVYALGYGGMFLIIIFGGALVAFLDVEKVSNSWCSVRSTVYLYLSYTLYTDLAIFMAGWWLLLLWSIVYLFLDSEPDQQRRTAQ